MNRNIDALIAEKIFGCKVKVNRIAYNFECGCKPHNLEHESGRGDSCWIPEYSTRLDDAWKIVEKIPMTISAPGVDYWKNDHFVEADLWRVEARDIFYTKGSRYTVEATASTAFMAICLCALKSHHISWLSKNL